MLNRKKIIFGAVALVLITAVLTSSAFFYLLKLSTGDAVNTLRFLRALQIVRMRYVEQPSQETLLTGAIKGMVNSLDDPHSVYMDAKMLKQFLVSTEGSFGGIGVVLGIKDKALTVVAPIEGTPGDKAGIKSGDQILQVNGNDIKDLALDEVVNKIRGPEGTKVVLTIKNTKGEIKDVTVIRSNIKIKTVGGKILKDGIGYIRISMFSEETGKDFDDIYKQLETEGMKALILDLRDNPGGLVTECVNVAGKLIPKGPIVSVVDRGGHKETYSSSLAAVKYPLAVLVNGGSASASEIIAGAVQDTKAGTLIGTKTYGKGSVQTLLRLDASTGIKLTIAKYLTPAGRSINGVGIEPDIHIELGDQPKTDVQLEKALSILPTAKK